MTTTLDINELISKGNVTVSSAEHDEDRKARLTREDRLHRFELLKSGILFGILVLSYLLMFGLCGYVLIFNDFSMETTAGKLASLGLSTLFSGLVSGLAGMLIGARNH